MAAVPIREYMDGHETVVIARGKLNRRIGIVLDLGANIVEHLMQPCRNLDPRRAQVLLRASRAPSPAPNSVEHASVDRVYEARIQWVAPSTRERPLGGFENVGFFVLIELALKRQMNGDEFCRLIWIYGRGAWRVFEPAGHY